MQTEFSGTKLKKRIYVRHINYFTKKFILEIWYHFTKLNLYLCF